MCFLIKILSFLKKLVEQIAVCAMNFHTIESGALRVFRTLAIGFDDFGNLI